MTDVGADFWVCGDCRSVNKLRSKQCYNCRTPKEVAEVDPANIEGTGHGKLREIAIPDFHASRGEAVLASALIIGVATMQVVSTVLEARLLGRVLNDPEVVADPQFVRSPEVLLVAGIGLATLGVALFALAAWAYWLSRVVVAMPALGLGYPAANGLMAFVENFLPGLNLFRVPAIVRDVIRRLEPGSGRGEALIFAAWIGLFGGFLVPRVGGFVGAFGSGTLEDVVGQRLLINGVATGLVLVGAIFLVVLIWWIEQRIARRRIAQLEGQPSTAAPVSAAAPVEAAPGGTAPFPSGRGAAEPGGIEALDERPLERPFAPLAAAGAATPLPGAVEALDERPLERPFAPPVAAAPVAGPPARVAGPLGSVGAPTADPVLGRSITAATGAASIQTRLPDPRTPEPPPAVAEPPIAEPPIEEPPPAVVPEGPADSEARTEDETLAPPDPPPAPVPRKTRTARVARTAPVDETVAPPEDKSTVPVAETAPPPVVEATVPAEPPHAETVPPAEESPPASTDQRPTGPRLHLRVESATSMIATIDGESEPITLDELRAAAEALARADGSAVIATMDTTFGVLSLAEEAFEVLSDARVDTTLEE